MSEPLKLRPLGALIHVRELPVDNDRYETLDSGLVIVRERQPRKVRGIVHAVGPAVPEPIEVGEVVWFGRTAGRLLPDDSLALHYDQLDMAGPESEAHLVSASEKLY